MNRLPPSVAAFALALSACGSRVAALPPRVLAAADPASAEAPYTPPSNALGGPRPRTLALEIADPTRMHHSEPAPEVGTEHEHAGGDHSTHPTPTPTPTPARRPPGQEETIYACPMHPEVRDTKPGVCPRCNMRLEPVPTPPASATPTPSAVPSPTATPGGHEHHQGTEP